MSGTLEATGSESYQGYFGKVPVRGDFVGKGLPRSFRQPWDIWLQSVIDVTKKNLKTDWDQFYLTCPAYRFALSPGVCGKESWIGVMIPSVDQVGRYYPMVLARSLVNNADPFSAISGNDQWFHDAESLVLSCLSDGFSLGVFDAQVNKLEPEQLDSEQDDSTSVQRVIQTHPKSAWRMTASNLDQPQLYSSLVHSVLQKYCLSYSVWWTAGSDIVLPSMIVGQGLPPLSGVSALLDGNWDQWGWKDSRLADYFFSE